MRYVSLLAALLLSASTRAQMATFASASDDPHTSMFERTTPIAGEYSNGPHRGRMMRIGRNLMIIGGGIAVTGGALMLAGASSTTGNEAFVFFGATIFASGADMALVGAGLFIASKIYKRHHPNLYTIGPSNKGLGIAWNF